MNYLITAKIYFCKSTRPSPHTFTILYEIQNIYQIQFFFFMISYFALRNLFSLTNNIMLVPSKQFLFHLIDEYNVLV